MLRFRVLLLAAILSLLLGLVVATASADDNGDTVDIIVRLYLDENNDVNDRGDRAVANRPTFTVVLRGPGINMQGSPGPNGFVNFFAVPAEHVGDYRLNVQFNGNGWQLARSVAPYELIKRGKTYHSTINYFTIPVDAFIERNNGDTEAWVRFSFVKDPRITVSGATPGDFFEVIRVANNRQVHTDLVGPNGYASFVRGGLFYGEAYEVRSDLTTNSIICTIPFGYQPKATVNGQELVPGRACEYK